jgi:hypothetical protein
MARAKKYYWGCGSPQQTMDGLAAGVALLEPLALKTE